MHYGYGQHGAAASMYGSKPPVVRKLVVQTTGTYNQQFLRPYTSALVGGIGQNIMNSLEETMARDRVLTPQSFVQPYSNFVTQDATPECPVGIANNWGTERLRFMLDLESEDHMGNRSNLYVFGYTERSDLTYNRAIDPNMRFYINSMVETKNVVQTTGMGAVGRHEVNDTSQILVNRGYESAFNQQHQLYMTTPQAIFTNWENIAMLEGGGEEAEFVDGRQQVTGQPVKVKRANAIAPVYSRDILHTYINEVRNNHHDQTNILTNCAAAVASQPITRDGFLSHLMEMRRRDGDYLRMNDNSFTLNDLIRLDPNAKTKIEPCAVVNGQHRAGMTHDWGGSDRWDQTATILGQSIPAYMARSGFSFVHLFSTNLGTMEGQPVTTIAKHNGWNNHLDQRAQIDALAYALSTELFRSISLGGTLKYELEARVSTGGETWLTLSLNGESPRDYVMPSFADALLAPVVTHNRANLDGITTTVDTVTNRLWATDSSGLRSESLSGDKIFL